MTLLVTTSGVSLSLHLAVMDDLDAIVDLLEEAAAWLYARGIPHWPPGATRADPSRIIQNIERAEAYIAFAPQGPAATFALQWADPELWGTRPPDAGYLHRLAVGRAVAGCGVGPALIRWAETSAARRERAYLRLDCVAANPAICRYYEILGFEPRATVELRQWRLQLFEKVIGP